MKICSKYVTVPRMARINSRQKGKKGERETAKIFREFGFDARRGQQYKGSSESQDIVVNGWPFHLENKRTQKFFGPDWLAKAQHDAAQGLTEGQIALPPMVIWRPNHHPAYAFCHLTELLRALKDVRFPIPNTQY